MAYIENSNQIEIELEGKPYYIHTGKMLVHDVFLSQNKKVEDKIEIIIE